MKRNLLLFGTLMLPMLVFSQKNEGIVVYSQTINLHQMIPDERARQWMPEKQTFESELFFQGGKTLFKPKKSEQPQQVTADDQSSGWRMMMNRRRDNTIVYRDLTAGTHLEATAFMDKEFLIEGADPTISSNWKVTGKQKMVAGYPCISATRSDSAMGRPREITAWFTPAIPVQSGPQSFGGLPGLILEIDQNQGQMLITATSVEIKALEAGVMAAPDKGKRVTREEYRKIVEERMKEMREMRGGAPGAGGGTFIIRNG